MSASSTDSVSSSEVNAGSPRIHSVDFARGLACLSMPFYHTLYNLYTVGLTDTLWTKTLFWTIYQKLGLGAFVFISGMAFILSTKQKIHWPRLTRRALKLGAIALAISLATYLVIPGKFVRFGVIHFFACSILLAPLFRPLRYWSILPGLAIVVGGIMMAGAGLYPEHWLYFTGLMSDRPRSIDYIPLVPWFGVFLVGMGCAHWLKIPKTVKSPRKWQLPIIWLGKHSLPFYVLHQLLIYVLLQAIALLI